MNRNNFRDMSPRQRMINLMYLVLTALLALSVPGDVLEGFKRINSDITDTNKTLDAICASQIESGVNSVKLNRIEDIHFQTRNTLKLIDSVKSELKIVDDPVFNQYSKSIVASLSEMRTTVLASITDSISKEAVEKALVFNRNKFTGIPVSASKALLSKLQTDILFAENQAISAILSDIENENEHFHATSAVVIPVSSHVVLGTSYKAQIIPASTDSAQQYNISINGKQISSDGTIVIPATRPGINNISGFLEMSHTKKQLPFNASFTVIEPISIIASQLTNVLYAGIDNPVSISVSGYTDNDILAKTNNGTISRNNDGKWNVKPILNNQEEAIIKIMAKNSDGSEISVGSHLFKVRSLPDPTPFLQCGNEKISGKRAVNKSLVAKASSVEATIDDGILNINFKVVSFETLFFDSMGNAIPETSNGNQFSPRQLKQLQNLQRGKRFFISRIKALGPDGIMRSLSPMEIQIN